MAAWEHTSRFQFETEDMEETLDIRRARLMELPPEKGADSYDPRDHRDPTHEIKPWMAYFDLLRIMCNVGLLGMPVAFSASGYFIGSMFTILIGCLIIHTHHLLLHSLTEISRQLKIPYISYRYGFRIALLHGPEIFHCIGHRGPTIVGILMILSQLGISSVSIIMTTHSLKDILSTDKALKNPRIMTKPCGVINVGLGIPTVVSLLFGALGYWSFGTMEESVLRSLPFEDLTSLLAIGIFMVSVMVSLPLNCYPAIDVIVEMIKFRKKSHHIPTEQTLNLIQTIARPAFLLTSFAIAYNIPHQGPFRAFVGHLCTTMLSVVFPAMMDICLRSGVPEGYGVYNYYLIKDLTIISLGCITWILGIYYCGYLIYIRILSSYSPNNEGFL